MLASVHVIFLAKLGQLAPLMKFLGIYLGSFLHKDKYVPY